MSTSAVVRLIDGFFIVFRQQCSTLAKRRGRYNKHRQYLLALLLFFHRLLAVKSIEYHQIYLNYSIVSPLLKEAGSSLAKSSMIHSPPLAASVKIQNRCFKTQVHLPKKKKKPVQCSKKDFHNLNITF